MRCRRGSVELDDVTWAARLPVAHGQREPHARGSGTCIDELSRLINSAPSSRRRESTAVPARGIFERRRRRRPARGRVVAAPMKANCSVRRVDRRSPLAGMHFCRKLRCYLPGRIAGPRRGGHCLPEAADAVARRVSESSATACAKRRRPSRRGLFQRIGATPTHIVRPEDAIVARPNPWPLAHCRARVRNGAARSLRRATNILDTAASSRFNTVSAMRPCADSSSPRTVSLQPQSSVRFEQGVARRIDRQGGHEGAVDRRPIRSMASAFDVSSANSARWIDRKLRQNTRRLKSAAA